MRPKVIDYRLLIRFKIALNKAIEGLSHERLVDYLRLSFPTTKEIEEKVCELEEEAANYRRLRNTILGTPWNLLKDSVSKAIEQNKNNNKQN